MAFHFTEEDFRRYVKQEEHGGRHIWHELQDELQGLYGVPFSAAPYVARGDRLQLLWLAPKKTVRPSWTHQAQFYLIRSIEDRQLLCGLLVEYWHPEQVTDSSLDPDRDGLRLMRLLDSDPGFAQQLDRIAALPGWSLTLSVWGKTRHKVENAAEMRALLEPLPQEQGWDVGLFRRFSAEEAIAAGESITAQIMDVYSTLRPLWEAVMPEADRKYLQDKGNPDGEYDRDSEACARRIIEQLLPEAGSRRVCLNLMADYILEAHKHSPATWETTLFLNKVRLNIGAIQAFVIHPNKVYLVTDGGSLSEQNRALLDEHGKTGIQSYVSVPDAHDMEIAAAKVSLIDDLVRQTYAPAIETAFRAGKRTPYYRSHAPGVVKYLRRFLGRDIPDPDYGDDGKALLPFDLQSTLDAVFAARHLAFTPWQVATFYTALQTKGLVILSGISGTGKTKLAQAFAEALPQPVQQEIAVTDDLISITVQPYMLKYSRVVIPKHATRLFDPPGPGEAREVQVSFDGQSQECRLQHATYTGTRYLSLFLRGKARQWFSQHLTEGDTLIVEPLLEKGETLSGFRLSSAAEAQQAPGSARSLPNWLFLPVRPDWRDSKSLLGYYNPLTGTYEWTAFLRFLVRACKSYEAGDGLAWFLILDEMNLAHVEYYFADLLSVLESGRGDDGWTREALRLAYPDDAEGDLPLRELRLPPNLYIVGTVNIDETTHAFSPKVLDRAFTLELTEADFLSYPALGNGSSEPDSGARQSLLREFSRGGRFARIEKGAIAQYVTRHPEVRSHLQELNRRLQPYDLHFGYRVFDEIVAFLAAAEANGLYASLGGGEAALDAAVLMKVLPKFHGSRGRIERPLQAVLAWCVDPENPNPSFIQQELERTDGDLQAVWDKLSCRLPATARRVQRMLRALYTTGFAAFG